MVFVKCMTVYTKNNKTFYVNVGCRVVSFLSYGPL